MSASWPPPKQSYGQSFSDNYYCDDTQQQIDYTHYNYSDGYGVPRTVCIDPQALLSPYSITSDMMGGDYNFPTPATYPSVPRPAIEDEYFMEYDGQRNQRQTLGAWTPDQMQKSYDTSSTHRSSSRSANCWDRPTHLLPTPPPSPTSVLPVPNSSIADCGVVTSTSSSTTDNININTYTNSTNSTNSTNTNKRTTNTKTTTQKTKSSSSASPKSSGSSSSSRHYCSHPQCVDPASGHSTKSFSRRADLQRHHDTKHDTPPLYSCPRPNCSRKGDSGFTRKDHLVEHRRGYHGEDIPKRGERSGDGSSPRGVEKRR